jgi:DNA-binding winged helix-turn-helix (wHTH) protein
MAATIKAPISPFRQPKREPNPNSTHFLDEDLASVPVSGIPEEFRKLSSFFPVIVLVPKIGSPRYDPEKGGAETSPALASRIPGRSAWTLAAAKHGINILRSSDTFAFGGVTVCFSTMEIHRNGRPVALKYKEFKTLAYLIKNPRRVISRDELLNEVWGYQNYPCTRTVDNHILSLRKKLETEPAHPKHFHTVHSAGYKFLP